MADDMPKTAKEAVDRLIEALKKAQISATDAQAGFEQIADQQKEAKMADEPAKKTYKFLWAAPQSGDYGTWSYLHKHIRTKVPGLTEVSSESRTYLKGADGEYGTTLYVQHAQFTAENDEGANKIRMRILQAMLEFQQENSAVIFFLEGPAGVLIDISDPKIPHRVPPGLIVLELE